MSEGVNDIRRQGAKSSGVKMHLAGITGGLCHISADECGIEPNVAAVKAIMAAFMV